MSARRFFEGQNTRFRPKFSAIPHGALFLNFAPKSRPEGLDEAPIFIRTLTTACLKAFGCRGSQRLHEVRSETQKRCVSQRRERAAKKKGRPAGSRLQAGRWVRADGRLQAAGRRLGLAATGDRRPAWRRRGEWARRQARSQEQAVRPGPGRGPGPAVESGVETGLATYQTLLSILGAAVVLKVDIVVLYVCACVRFCNRFYII
jgi:hypothetical protein